MSNHDIVIRFQHSVDEALHFPVMQIKFSLLYKKLRISSYIAKPKFRI